MRTKKVTREAPKIVMNLQGKGKKKGKYQSDKKGDKKVTKNGDECSELQNSSLEKSPKKVKKKVNHRKSHQKSLKKTWAPICPPPLTGNVHMEKKTFQKGASLYLTNPPVPVRSKSLDIPQLYIAINLAKILKEETPEYLKCIKTLLFKVFFSSYSISFGATFPIPPPTGHCKSA